MITNNKQNFIDKIYIIWYNGNNSEMKTDSVTAKDRHVINSSPFGRHQIVRGGGGGDFNQILR